MARNQNQSATMGISEVRELMNNRSISLRQKVEILKAANYRKTDIENLLFINGLSSSNLNLERERVVRDQSINTLTFGVEIETLVKSRYELEAELKIANVKAAYESYNHTNSKDHFKIVSDGSVIQTDYLSAELVSPILKGNAGLLSLKQACEVLALNSIVNKTCGVHVHIGAEKFTLTQWQNLYINIFRLENVIDSFMPESRRDNSYCMSFRKGMFSDYESKINSCNNVEDIRAYFQNNRYFKINPVSYSRHKTIEFRQHAGTTDFKKIEMWVNFLRKLVIYSKNNKVDQNISSPQNIPFLSNEEKTFFTSRQRKFSNSLQAV